MPENTSSSSQKGRIFISYRRTDSAGYAGRIYDRLVANFGEDAIFMDVDTIEGGTDFVKVLEDAVQSCDVLIALIGRQWLGIKDKDGKRRLDSPEDFVRIEISTALQRDIRVIPVLVDGIEMPRSTDLPENLKALARRNALQVNHHSFNPDVFRLIEHSESALDEAEVSRVMKAQALQVAQEKAAKEIAEREAAEKAAREIAAKDAKEKTEKDVAEKARLEAEEKARKKVAQKAAISNTLANILSILKSIFSNSKLIFRTISIFGIVVILIWFGSWSVPKLASLLPTATMTATYSLTPKPITPSQTYKPTQVDETPTITLTPTESFTPSFTFTATPLPTEITDAKGVSMVLVPAGEFTMGSEDFIDTEPVHTVYLGSFYIDKYEVTNAHYKTCVDANGCTPPQYTNSFSRATYYRNSTYDDYPVIYIDWDQANAYCSWRESSLPTEEQWEKAARGTDDRIYPWGSGRDCSKSNYRDCIGDTTKVDRYELGKSPYGIYDLEGNVSEWILDWYAPYPGNTLENTDFGTKYRVVRGASWFTPYWFGTDWLNVATRERNAPDSIANDIGFRCAKDATP